MICRTTKFQRDAVSTQRTGNVPCETMAARDNTCCNNSMTQCSRMSRKMDK